MFVISKDFSTNRKGEHSFYSYKKLLNNFCNTVEPRQNSFQSYKNYPSLLYRTNERTQFPELPKTAHSAHAHSAHAHSAHAHSAHAQSCSKKETVESEHILILYT